MWYEILQPKWQNVPFVLKNRRHARTLYGMPQIEISTTQVQQSNPIQPHILEKWTGAKGGHKSFPLHLRDQAKPDPGSTRDRNTEPNIVHVVWLWEIYIYILYIYKQKKLFKVQIIGIFEEIDSFIDQKCTSWKCDKKIEQGRPPPSFGKKPKDGIFSQETVHETLVLWRIPSF